MQGWIKLHRKIMESAVWADPHYLKLWFYCLLKASHKEYEQLLGNQMVKLEVGQFVTGRKVMAEELNAGLKPEKKLSEKSWSRYLKNLEKWQMLTIKTTNKYSIVTVVNYRFYQELENESVHQNDQQLTNNCPTSDQQLTTNKNVKNDKNKYIDEIKKFRNSYSPEVQKLIDSYWNVIKRTRKTNKISYSVIYKTMEKWAKFEPIIIHYAIKKHIENYDDEEHNEKYTLGIMRNTTKEQAEDLFSQKPYKTNFNQQNQPQQKFEVIDMNKLLRAQEG